MAHAASTDVIAVKAGDTFEIAHVRAGPETGQWGTDFSFDDCPDNRGSCTSTRLNKDVRDSHLHRHSVQEQNSKMEDVVIILTG